MLIGLDLGLENLRRGLADASLHRNEHLNPTIFIFCPFHFSTQKHHSDQLMCTEKVFTDMIFHYQKLIENMVTLTNDRRKIHTKTQFLYFIQRNKRMNGEKWYKKI